MTEVRAVLWDWALNRWGRGWLQLVRDRIELNGWVPSWCQNWWVSGGKNPALGVRSVLKNSSAPRTWNSLLLPFLQIISHLSPYTWWLKALMLTWELILMDIKAPGVGVWLLEGKGLPRLPPQCAGTCPSSQCWLYIRNTWELLKFLPLRWNSRPIPSNFREGDRYSWKAPR